MLDGKSSAALMEHFVGQWLDTRKLENLMPDSRLALCQAELQLAKRESEQFFATMLRENRPLTDFIDPDFTITTAAIAEKVYGIDEGLKDTDALQRVALPRGGRYGGLLGQAAVLAATANGVHTQPVVRGVWVYTQTPRTTGWVWTPLAVAASTAAWPSSPPYRPPRGNATR